MKKTHSYLIYEFAKCQESERLLDDPPCAEPAAITDWLRTKGVHMRVLNDKIDFSQFGLGAIRQNEIWMPLMKFKEGYYTDAGYRFRENKFE